MKEAASCGQQVLSDPRWEVDAELNTDTSAQGALFPWQSGVTKFTVNHDARPRELETNRARVCVRGNTFPLFLPLTVFK